jgi:hypothetical protein
VEVAPVGLVEAPDEVEVLVEVDPPPPGFSHRPLTQDWRPTQLSQASPLSAQWVGVGGWQIPALSQQPVQLAGPHFDPQPTRAAVATSTTAHSSLVGEGIEHSWVQRCRIRGRSRRDNTGPGTRTHARLAHPGSDGRLSELGRGDAAPGTFVTRDDALACAAQEFGLAEGYRPCVLPLIRDREGRWPRCCGSGCEPCAQTLVRVAARALELMGSPRQAPLPE